MTDSLEADYVIVGAGSAGCVLANRLSADGRARVVLLEAGGDDRPTRNLGQFYPNLMIHIPAGYVETMSNPQVNWMYTTEPDPSTDGRVHFWPRGKVFGGSSSINGMLYIRGQHADYDGWAQTGCAGWSWDDVKPYFIRSEDQQRGASDWHGVGGPLRVSDVTDRHIVSDAIVEAFAEAGLPRNADINGAEQEGATYFQQNIRAGQRCSSAVAYLHPAMGRASLRVEANALATRVIFEGRKAVGVEFVQHGVTRQVKARREVILAGGAINSPQLLQLSGVGPAELLGQHGIEVVADLPGVGENLHDHYMVATHHRLRGDIVTLNELRRGLRFVGQLARYALVRKGILSTSPAHIAAFCKSRPELDYPDIQFHILPMTMGKPGKNGKPGFDDQPGLTIAPCQLRPESRGSVRIRSADPAAAPAIAPNYLADPMDQEVIVQGLKWVRRLTGQPSLAPYIQHEINPGPGVVSDTDLLAYSRAAGSTLFHPVGTCAMGIGRRAVVDASLRVHGVEGLRVVDASVMPKVVSGNTNAPTIMIAEKASDLILADAA